MSIALGMDFGTTNSLCAWLDGDRPSLIANTRGSRLTPSVVAVTRRGEILVGESARNQALVNPENTVQGVKRLLGSEGLLSMGGKDYRPEELVAMILGSLRADAERLLAREFHEAVVTAPAHFGDRERRALVEAGRLAGLTVVRVVNEPTAAAIARAYAMRALTRERSLILVYDFGGGTFDVTILEQEGSQCSVLASRGDGRLGGSDLDRELRRLASSSFRAKEGLDFESDRLLAQQLADAAERAKIELSEREEATIALAFAATGGRVVHPSYTLTRSEFEELALPYVERSLELVEMALSDAGVEAGSIGALVLSGGSSRIPLVRRLVSERIGLKPEGGINPEEIVALGAAVWASLSPARPEDHDRLRVKDVVSRSYGVEVDGGSFVPLIRKNNPVPATRSRVFTTVSDGQESVEIHVLQGESPKAAENVSLGRFLLAGIPPTSAGIPRVRVDFTIDESDMLRVAAVELGTGVEQAISIAALDEGAAAETAEELAHKTCLLADRLGELKKGLALERGLESELDEITVRARSARATEGREGELRLLKAELESLVGELLARRAETRAPRSARFGPKRSAGIREDIRTGIRKDANKGSRPRAR